MGEREKAGETEVELLLVIPLASPPTFAEDEQETGEATEELGEEAAEW